MYQQEDKEDSSQGWTNLRGLDAGVWKKGMQERWGLLCLGAYRTGRWEMESQEVGVVGLCGDTESRPQVHGGTENHRP